MRKFIYSLYIILLIVPFMLISCDLDDDDLNESKSDYIEVTINGKTYREDIPIWGYVILDGTERDSKGNVISLTNVVSDSFEEKYGFSFSLSMAHFASKEDLMASKNGEYLHNERFGNVWEGEFFCENFTLVSDLEINFDYYRFIKGTHYVRSVKGVGNDVQVEGTFDGLYECEENNKQCEVQGKYRMTLDVHDTSINPLD